MIRYVFGFLLLAFLLTLYPSDTHAQMQLTDRERLYIRKHPVIYVAGNPKLAPIEEYKNSSYVGVIPSLFERIEDKTGLTFKYINKNRLSKFYLDNQQAEIISGMTEKDLKNVSLTGHIMVLSSAFNDTGKIYIGFTDISGKELRVIIGKALKDITAEEKESIIFQGVSKSQENKISVEYMGSLAMAGIALVLFVLSNILLLRENKALKEKDELTGGDNYESLRNYIDKKLSTRSKANYYVVNFNINTKEVKKLYGYEEINNLMLELADVFRHDIDKRGGENFARLYDDTLVMIGMVSSRSIVENRIRNLIDTINRRLMEEGNRQYKVEVTAGIYFMQGVNDSFDQSVYFAMQAREKAFSLRQSVGVATADMIRDIGEQNRLEKEAITGLQKNEYVAFIQPIANVGDPGVEYGQVLARWDSMRYGLVRPDLFLNILDKHNLLDELDFLMFEKACSFLAEMHRQKKQNMTLFCSFSKDAVEKDDFYNRILAVIEDYNIPKRFLGIILNNQNMGREIRSLNESVVKLEESGIHILLDDFDQSPYALRNIKDLSVDFIKISRDLLVHLESDKESETILDGVIKTMHDVGVKVICKDFTDADNLPILKRLGCDFVQGNKYYYPILSDELLKMDLMAIE